MSHSWLGGAAGNFSIFRARSKMAVGKAPMQHECKVSTNRKRQRPLSKTRVDQPILSRCFRAL
jgi:hypothetical protein